MMLRFPYVVGLLAALASAVACGGQTEGDGLTRASAPGTGGSTSAMTDGAVDVTDPGKPDAAACDLHSLMVCPLCTGSELRSADVADCAITLSNTTVYAGNAVVAVGCVYVPQSWIGGDAGTIMSSEGWAIDYSTTPPRLVFGDALCQRVGQDVSIFIFGTCGVPC